MKGFEDPVHITWWDTGTIVLDLDDHHLIDTRKQANMGRLAVIDGIGHQIDQGPFQGERPGTYGQMRRSLVAQLFRQIRMRVPGFIEDGPKQFREVERRHRFGRPSIASERQRGGDHRFQFLEVSEDFATLLVVLDELGPQLQPCDRRSQIVSDRGQQLGPILHEPANTAGHGVECGGGHGDLGRATFRQRRRVDVAAQSLGRRGQYANRRGQSAHRP